MVKEETFANYIVRTLTVEPSANQHHYIQVCVIWLMPAYIVLACIDACKANLLRNGHAVLQGFFSGTQVSREIYDLRNLWPAKFMIRER